MPNITTEAFEAVAAAFAAASSTLTKANTAPADSFLDSEPAAPKKAKGGKEYPVFPDTDQCAEELVNAILADADAVDRLDSNKKLLADMVKEFYFQTWEGKPEAESSIKVRGTNRNALVTFQARCAKLADKKAIEPIRALIGEREKDLFRWDWKVEIDGSQISIEAGSAFLADLRKVATQYGLAPGVVAVKKEYKPTAAFHVSRHTLFTAHQNLAINEVVPIVAVVKTKGVS